MQQMFAGTTSIDFKMRNHRKISKKQELTGRYMSLMQDEIQKGEIIQEDGNLHQYLHQSSDTDRLLKPSIKKLQIMRSLKFKKNTDTSSCLKSQRRSPKPSSSIMTIVSGAITSLFLVIYLLINLSALPITHIEALEHDERLDAGDIFTKSRKVTTEPFLVLLSKSELSLVELPLIDNGQISTIYKLNEDQCSTSYQNEIQNNRLADADSVESDMEFGYGDTGGRGLAAGSEESRTQDSGANSGGGGSSSEQTHENDVKSNGRITTTTNSSDTTPASGQEVAASSSGSKQQMRKKRASLATSLGKSRPNKMVNLKPTAQGGRWRLREKRHAGDIANNDRSNGNSDGTDFKLEQAHAEAQHGHQQQQQTQQQIATLSDMDAGNAKSGSSSDEQLLAQANDCELNDFDVHMQQGLIFASDNRGQIHRIKLDMVSAPEATPNSDSNDNGSSFASASASASSSPSGSSETIISSSSGNQTDQQTTTSTSNELQWTTPPSSDTLERLRDEPKARSSQHPSPDERMFPASPATLNAATSAAASGASQSVSQHDRIIWSRLSQSLRRHDKGAWSGNRKLETTSAKQQLASERMSNHNSKNNGKNSTKLQQGSQSLAVDWINNVLFVLDQNRLFCLDFEGKREILLIDDFGHSPSQQAPLNLRVDPLNNFLFWLQPGRFHASIYRLDLGVLLSNELTMERMRSNLNKSITTPSSNANPKTNPSSVLGGGSGNGGMSKGPFDIANQEALISRHYAHPIITNLPKQTKLFFIDHKHSRIYVPIVQQAASSSESESSLTSSTSTQNLTGPSGDAANATCNDSQAAPADGGTAGNGQGQILTYNLDSSDAGPLRSGSEREHWSSFQPGPDMQDLSLDSSQNLLYWLTNNGRGIFEEYLGDDGKLHSAQHTLDGQNVYSKLLYFSPLANQTNQPPTNNMHKHKQHVSTMSPIGTLMKLLADHQEHLSVMQQVNLKHKKSIYGLGSWTSSFDGSSADLLVNGPMDLRAERDSISSNSYLVAYKPWLILFATGLFLGIVYFVYALVFDERQRQMLASNSNNNERNSSSPSSADSMRSSTLSSRAGARFAAGASTISRWIQTKGGLMAQHHATNDVACSITGLSSQPGSGYPGCNYNIGTPTTAHSHHKHSQVHVQMLGSNAIDEHYGQEQLVMPSNSNGSGGDFLGLPNLSEWPSSVSDFTNKLYVPIEVMQDDELASIRRISSEKLEIDRHSAPLGKGHFGTVLQGVIKNCSASERAEWLTPPIMSQQNSRQFSASSTNNNFPQPHYENQSRLESLLKLQASNVIPKKSGYDLQAAASVALNANANGLSGGSSTSGHGSANSASSPSDVFLTARQLTSTSAASVVSNTANTGDYLTPKSQCGQSVSDYGDDHHSLSLGGCQGSAITNPNYMFNPAAAVAATANISTLLLMKSSPFRVAIKQLKDDATPKEKQDFLQEAKLLAKFNHRNIVQLIGICLDRGSTFIVMELMLGGDLIRYMRKQCENELTMLDEDDLLSICLDIVDGCCYLAEQNYIHRDLAARNCLVSSCRKEERVVKLADFGLARDIYEGNYYKQSNSESAMPLKWMAPECLCGEPTFTSQSDVWSFGVVMWEVTNYCLETPYSQVAPFDLKKHLDSGKRLSKSKYCDDDLYKLMLSCWQMEPENRPTFRECQIELIEIRNKQQKKQQQQSIFRTKQVQHQDGENQIQQQREEQERNQDQQFEYQYHHQQCEI